MQDVRYRFDEVDETSHDQSCDGVGVSMSVRLAAAGVTYPLSQAPAQHSSASVTAAAASTCPDKSWRSRSTGARDNWGSNRLNTPHLHCRQGTKSWGLRLVGGQDVGTLLKVEKVDTLHL